MLIGLGDIEKTPTLSVNTPVLVPSQYILALKSGFNFPVLVSWRTIPFIKEGLLILIGATIFLIESIAAAVLISGTNSR